MRLSPNVVLLLTVFVASVCLSNSATPSYRPVVLWHGMGDTCCYPFSMGAIKKLIETQLPGIYVYSIEVGDSIAADEFNSYFMNANDQIEYVNKELNAIPELANGFNAMGFSQGGQFLRAYVERFNSPKVYNLISVGGQHQGVFGLPKCMGNSSWLCEKMREMLNYGAYEKEIQEHLAQAEYWHDPLQLDVYLDKCIFLPDVNNELPTKNATYKQNFMSLNELALVLFTQDSVVQPRESEWFGFYQEGQDKILVPVQNTTLYQEDTIGLKYLMDNNKVTFLSCDGDHLQFSDPWFIQNLVPFINNTLP